jgi:hypothetical protein
MIAGDIRSDSQPVQACTLTTLPSDTACTSTHDRTRVCNTGTRMREGIMNLPRTPCTYILASHMILLLLDLQPLLLSHLKENHTYVEVQV